jgi:predicted metal-dependent phosphoesterase TrpH
MKTIIAPGYKMIEGTEADKLFAKNQIRIDTHVHSEASYDVLDLSLSADKLIQHTNSLGLLPVLTDHNTYNGVTKAKRVFEAAGKSVNFIPGVEFSLKSRKAMALDISEINDVHTLHIGVLGLNELNFKDLDAIAKAGDLDSFTEYCRKNKLAYVYHHIFWSEAGEYLNWKAVPLLVKNYFDVVELNAKRTKEQNDLTLKLAKELGVAIVAASDSHIGAPGKAFTFGAGRNFKEFWWDTVIPGNAYFLRDDLATLDFIVEVKKFIKDFFAADPAYLRSKGILLETGVGFFQMLMNQLAYGKLREVKGLRRMLEFLLENVASSPLGRRLIERVHVKPQKKSALEINDFVLSICKNLA